MDRARFVRLSARAKSRGLFDVAVRYNPWALRRVRKAVHAAGRDARAEQVDALGRRILAAARDTRYGAGRSERLEHWPVLTKAGPLAAPADFVNRRTVIRVPAGSGGTTGAPMQLWRSMECIAAEQFFLDRLLAPYGLSMRSKLAILRADTVKPTTDTAPPYGRISHRGTRLTLSSPHLNAGTVGWYVEHLQQFAPEILWVYPSAAVNLLSLMQSANLKLRPRVILASSELLSAPMHAELERFFEATVINYYGQAERACLAWSTRPDEFFFEPLYGKVELEVLEPISEGPVAARIIATGFWNTAMPLIRYDTGDLLHLPSHPGTQQLAAIASGERSFAGLAGRSGEYLLTREGLRIIGLNHIPREVSHIYQIQLVQSDWNTLDIDVLPMPDFSAADEQLLIAQARAKLPASFQVNVRRVTRLRQAASGKIPVVIREVWV